MPVVCLQPDHHGVLLEIIPKGNGAGVRMLYNSPGCYITFESGEASRCLAIAAFLSQEAPDS
jgi:hypothetical protein